MPLWRNVNEAVKVGDRVEGGYKVVAVKWVVSPTVLVRNHTLRTRRDLFAGTPLEPEVPIPFARLVLPREHL